MNLMTFRANKLSILSAGILGAAVLIGAFANVSPAAEEGAVTVVSYGGGYQEAQDKAFFTPFAKANASVTVRQDSPTSNAKLKAMVESGNVTWDIALVDDSFGLESDAEWLEPIDYSIVDKDKFLEGYAGTYRVGADVEATVMAYRSDHFAGKAPATYADFFDTEKFPGKRALWKFAPGGIFEAALLADGVAPEELYPLDIERALKKLDTIKDNIIWWETGAQAEQLLASGEASLGLVWVSRAINASGNGSVSISWGNWTSQNGFWVVPKGTKNKELAMKAIEFFTSVPQQVEFTKYMPYGPTNKDATDKVADRYKGNLPTDHLDTRVVVDSAWWNANTADVDLEFQDWLLQ
jgi:putative spermidine/putrescine transport system substrate-binding protein